MTAPDPIQSRDKAADVAHMLVEVIGLPSVYDETFAAWFSVRNDYDALYVDVEFQPTPDRNASNETYRLTVERVK